MLAARLRWLRASPEQGDATLHRHAVGMRRRVSGDTLRTVVIGDDGERHYAHLLVPGGADLTWSGDDGWMADRDGGSGGWSDDGDRGADQDADRDAADD